MNANQIQTTEQIICSYSGLPIRSWMNCGILVHAAYRRTSESRTQRATVRGSRYEIVKMVRQLVAPSFMSDADFALANAGPATPVREWAGA